jgi:hypothetical protein
MRRTLNETRATISHITDSASAIRVEVMVAAG